MYLKELDRVRKKYWSNLCRQIESNFLRQNPGKSISDLVEGNMTLPICFRWGHTPEGYRFWKQKEFRFLYSPMCFRDFILKHNPLLKETMCKNFVNLNKALDNKKKTRSIEELTPW